MNCWSVPGKVKSFSISLQDWLKSLKKWSEVQDFKRPQRWRSIIEKTGNGACFTARQTAAFPIVHRLSSGSGCALMRLCTINMISMPFKSMKSEGCMFHSHQAITEMGKALSLHLKAFHQKPIRLSIPAGKRPNVSERRECCDRILN